MAEDAKKTARCTAASKETGLVHVYIGKRLKTVQKDREHVLCEQPCTYQNGLLYFIML